MVDAKLIGSYPSVREHLGTVIQAGGAEVGHSSVEDAVATMNLVKWYVLEKSKTNASTLGRAS